MVKRSLKVTIRSQEGASAGQSQEGITHFKNQCSVKSI